jgi:hypothetical protein
MQREGEMQNGNSTKLGASMLRFENAFGPFGLRACCMRPIARSVRSQFNQIVVVISTVEYHSTGGEISAAVAVVANDLQAPRRPRLHRMRLALNLNERRPLSIAKLAPQNSARLSR